MSSDVTKRALSAGLGVGALALLAPRASADTPFSSFAFRATGAPTARTLPDRLGELKTVKDFGARGDGATDDTAAFQAAANSVSQIFIPPGIYNIGTVFLNHEYGCVRFVGHSATLQFIGKGGFMFHRTAGSEEGSQIELAGLFFRYPAWNAATDGCIKLAGLTRLHIHDCDFESRQCIKLMFDFAASGYGVRGASIERCGFRGVAGAPDANGIPWGSESIAIDAQGPGLERVLEKLDFKNFGRCINLTGVGGAVVRDIFGEMVSIGVDAGDGILVGENIGFEAPYVCGIIMGQQGSLTGSFIANDGWENNNTGGVDGIRFREGGSYFLDNVSVEGARTGGALVFPDGNIGKSVFMRVNPTVAGSGVAWKNFVPSPNLTLLQCNNP